MLAPALKTYTIARPAWIWPDLAELVRAAGGRLEIDSGFSAPERKVLRKRKKIAASLWSEKHRWVSLSSVPGPWRNDVAPYGAGIMDASFFQSVREIVICAAPQTGKSEAVNNCIGYAIDRAPGPVLYNYPDRDTAKENARDRIQTMITDSPRLRSYVRSFVDDVQNLYIRLAHMPIYFGWARSVARLANKPIKYLVQDEVDKFVQSATSKESDPISLAEKRLRTYRGASKNWKLSSPTVESGPIWQAFLAADARFDFNVVCPHCAAGQRMVFGGPEDAFGIKFPKEIRDPNEMERGNHARYMCRGCGKLWDDEDRNRAVRAGSWRERDTGEDMWEVLRSRKPAKIAFHIPAWLSYFVGLSECAAAFLKGAKNKAKLRDFQNGYAAEPWVEYEQVRQEDAILALRDDRPQGLVPSGGDVAALFFAADTQDNGFWYEIRAWGWGLAMDSWQVRFGFVDSLGALAEVLWGSEYRDADGGRYGVEFGLIDSGGHRTAEVYEFCRQPHPCPIMPSKGQGRMGRLHDVSKIDVYPGTSKIIPGGLWLLNINVNQYKDALDGKLKVAPADPGAWRMCADCDEEWARQMTAETIDEKTGHWVNPRNRPNHAWDCSVLNLVAADFRKVRFRPRPEKKEKKDVIELPATAGWIRPAGGPSWIGRR